MITLCILAYLFIAFIVSLKTYNKGSYLDPSPYFMENVSYWKRYRFGLIAPLIFALAVGGIVGLFYLICYIFYGVVVAIIWIATNMP